MIEFTLTQVVAAVAGDVLKEKNISFGDIFTDTRKVSPNGLFIALCGERFDGHEFVAQAIAGGASGVIVSRDYDDDELKAFDASVIKVEDTTLAYQALGLAYRRRFAIPIVAVTGSNGKTTTKDLTAAVLGMRFKVLKTEANFNNEIGLPMTLLQLNSNHQAAVVEMGMRGRGQIAALMKAAEPTVGVVTNVGETHIELLGSLENIAAAKGEMVECLSPEGTVILNTDNPYVEAMAAKARGKVVRFGLGERADVRAVDIVSSGKQTEFQCVWQGEKYPMRLPLIGTHNVYNALAAIAAGLTLGVPMAAIQAGLEIPDIAHMRLEIKETGQYTIINDAYNASPASMRAAIETLSGFAKGRKIAVLGDMLELGDFAVEAHRQVGEILAQHQIACVFTVGKLGEIIAISAKEHGVHHAASFHSHEAAAEALKQVLATGDTVLLKGSRGMKMEKLIELI